MLALPSPARFCPCPRRLLSRRTPLSSTYWNYDGINPYGVSWGYSVDEHITTSMYMNGGSNHVLEMTVTRPGGNNVTFNFPWNGSHGFSEWGYPVGANARRTYVL